MSRRIWLPFHDSAEAQDALGPLPAGLVADYFMADGHWPDSIHEVELLVAPYMTSAAAVLERVGEMSALDTVQIQSAGYDDYLHLLPDHVHLANASGVHDTSTAELALALALASTRHLDEFARNMTSGSWNSVPAVSLADRRVLIVGYGHIGQAIERRLNGFEVASITRVARHARTTPLVQPVEELHDLLPDADVVFVILPLTPATAGLIGRDELALLPDGALLVNVARGKVVDTDALVDATSGGRIHAALDVTDPEPLPPDHPLWRSPGVLISPHVGGRSSAFEPRIHRLLRAQLARFASRQDLANLVR